MARESSPDSSAETSAYSRSDMCHRTGSTGVDRLPIDIQEEGIDIATSLCRSIIQQIRMLPDVHDQHWNKSRDVPMFMECHPMVRQVTIGRVLIADGPADATHFPHAGEVRFP